MSHVSRADTSVFGRWWWTVDRTTIGIVLILMAIGALLSFSASPAMAEDLQLGAYYFVNRHLIFLVPAALVFFVLSLFSPVWIWRLSVLGVILGLVGMATTLHFGSTVKGAERWIDLGLIKLQPSEFMKPAFFVVSAWLFALDRRMQTRWALPVNFALLVLILALLTLQKDFGQSVLFAAIWGFQLFLGGYRMIWIVGLGGLGGAAGFAAYTFMPHVRSRIDGFISAGGEQYQLKRASDAFNDGGWLGVGPGEGLVKDAIPDVHNDFIFSVLGEEFGLMACIGVLLIYTVLVLRGVALTARHDSLFTALAAAGLVSQLGLQALINMASTLALIPTKGMTLPFLSYGGSSLLSLAISMGIFLALTRRRPRQESVLEPDHPGRRWHRRSRLSSAGAGPQPQCARP